MRKRINKKCFLSLCLTLGLLLTGCSGNEAKETDISNAASVPAPDLTETSNEVSTEAEVSVTNELPGEASDEDVLSQISSSDIQDIAINSHNPKGLTSCEYGDQYITRDTVNVTYSAGNMTGLLPQTVSKDYEFYLNKDTSKWILALVGKFAIVGGFHYFLLYILPSYHYIGFAAMIVGIFTSIAPAQNVLTVIRKRNYKLIPICSTVFGALCNFFWLAFGIMLKDIYNIIPNAICFTINVSNTCIWIYFYITRDKKAEEKEDKEEELKDEDN